MVLTTLSEGKEQSNTPSLTVIKRQRAQGGVGKGHGAKEVTGTSAGWMREQLMRGLAK